MSHRLWERGLRPETGLQAVIRDGCGELGEAIAWVYGTTVIEQRCLFHKLRNVADKCREELKGEAHKETRKQLLEQAIAYYALDGVARELIRTTSLLERTNRELRRKFRQVCGFGSSTGAEVAIYIGFAVNSDSVGEFLPAPIVYTTIRMNYSVSSQNRV